MHDAALEELFTAGGIDARGWATWDEPSRLALLRRELASPRPLVHGDAALPPAAAAVVGAMRVCAAHAAAHGPAGLGALIVSMTRSLSDLLAVCVRRRARARRSCASRTSMRFPRVPGACDH